MGIFKSKEQSRLFFNDFKKIMDKIYTNEEIDELASYIAPGEESLIVQHLVGGTHHAFRRIRNAYLPMIMDCIQITSNGAQEIVLFDGKDDAVSQLEKIMGVKKSK